MSVDGLEGTPNHAVVFPETVAHGLQSSLVSNGDESSQVLARPAAADVLSICTCRH